MVCRRCGCEFDARRYRRADDSVRCPGCGAVYRRNVRSAPLPARGGAQAKARHPAPARRGGRGSPFARKLWKLPVWAWLAIAAAALIACAGAGRDQPARIQPADAPSNAAQAPTGVDSSAPQAAGIPIGRTADFGGARVEVIGATLRSVGGETYVICEYNWTNNSGETAQFIWQIAERAFQNGVALDTDYSLYDVETNQITDVMSGYSLTVRSVHKLSSPTDEITFTLEPLLDLEDAYEPLTFTVNPA